MAKGEKQPIVSPVQSIKIPPIPAELTPSNYWTFSFKFFKQIKYYGFSHVDTKWFVSMLERLKELCVVDKDQFDRQKNIRDNYRYHIVKWDAKNCPIRRSDLFWLPSAYLDNEEEFPIYQFDITRAHGRIIGFWDETSRVFQILLFDPLHNTYPDKIANYKVRDCYPLGSEYAGLQNYIDEIKQQSCEHDNCGYKRKLEKSDYNFYPDNIVIAYLDEETFQELERVKKIKSLSEIIYNGIIAE